MALITAVGSSLPIGKEVRKQIHNLTGIYCMHCIQLVCVFMQGPFVHISSIIADLMTRLLNKYVKIFSHVFAVSAEN